MYFKHCGTFSHACKSAQNLFLYFGFSSSLKSLLSLLLLLIALIFVSFSPFFSTSLFSDFFSSILILTLLCVVSFISITHCLSDCPTFLSILISLYFSLSFPNLTCSHYEFFPLCFCFFTHMPVFLDIVPNIIL